MTAHPRLILASASPRRRELLNQVQIACEVQPACIDESPLPLEPPAAYVSRVAAEKAMAVRTRVGPDRPVLAADTEVVLDGEIFGKPRDRAHAIHMLSRLSGREHAVLSAVSVCLGAERWDALSVSTVVFRELTRREMEAYWASGEPRDKAGAYAIQGLGAAFIRHLAGSYSGVMGLPLFETLELLGQAGIRLPGGATESPGTSWPEDERR